MSSGGEKSASAAVLRDAARGAPDSTDPEGSVAAPPHDRTDPNAQLPDAPAPERVVWKLLVLRGPKAGAELQLNGDIVTLGRGTDNGLTIPDVSVSRHHVRFSRDAEGFSITDLDSGNGTRVNGAKVQTARLNHGDEITLGDTALQIVKSGAPVAARPAAAPSGNVADSAVRTQDISRAQPTRAMEALPPLPAQPRRGMSTGRLVFYFVMLFLLAAFFAGAYIWKNRPDLVDQVMTPGGNADDPADKALAKAKERIAVRRWDEAADLLATAAAANPGNERLQHWAESAHFDAVARKLFMDAQAALTKGDYAQAQALASQVPPDADFGADAAKLVQSIPDVCANALNDARAALREGDRDRARDIVDRVLAVDPSNADAQSLRDFIQHPPAEKKAEPPAPIPRVVKQAAPRGPNFRCYGPAITAYLTNDLSSAARAASSQANPGCQDLSELLSEFRQHYSQGMEMANSERVPEAALELGKAVKIDAQIAEGRPSIPGRNAREQQSKMEYLLALDCKGDDQLARRVQHLRAALGADSHNDVAKKELDTAYGHAKEMFQDAYINKDTEPDLARREFRVVIQALPPGDEKIAKAQHFLQTLTGASTP